MKELYTGNQYLENNPNWHEHDSPWKARQILKIIQKNKISFSSVAEIGCGVGEILKILQQHLPPDITFSGFDISSAAIQKAQTKSNDKLKFYLEDLTQTHHFFDVLLIIDVVEHVEDCFGFLEKIKPKATFKIFHFPLDLSVQTVLRGEPIMYRRKTVGHIHYFTKDTALAALTDKGYHIIDYFYTASATELNASWNPKSLLMQLPRRLAYALNKDLAVRLLGGYSLMVLSK